jgi:hypothetical protein
MQKNITYNNMITDFKLFEQLGGFNLGDNVLIMYKVPKTDKREIVPVKIVTEDGIHYQFSFDVQNNPFPHQRPIPFDKNMVINKTADIENKTPMNPKLNNEQPVETDYSPASNPNSAPVNAMVLPNA